MLTVFVMHLVATPCQPLWPTDTVDINFRDKIIAVKTSQTNNRPAGITRKQQNQYTTDTTPVNLIVTD